MKLMSHQDEAVKIARTHDRYAFYWDCGTGKTIAALSIIKEKGGKTLVICPKSLMLTAWKSDAEHFPELKTVCGWHSNKQKRQELLSSDVDVVVINYEMFWRELKTIEKANFKRVIFDESSKLKSMKTRVTLAAIEYSQKVDSLYLLSGTPAPNSGIEYYSQMRCVDPDIFGTNFSRFTSKYFVPKKINIQKSFRCKYTGDTVSRQIPVITGYVPIRGREPEFLDRLKTKSWALTKEEAVDLPEQTDIPRYFDLSKAELTAYQDVENQLMMLLKENKTTFRAKAESAAMKCRQLTSGWMYVNDSKDVEHFGDSKLQNMQDLIEEIGNNKIVIWGNFRHEIDLITNVISDLKIKHSVLRGGVTAAQIEQAVTDFQKNDLQILINHPQSVGHGVTLTASNYAINFSCPWSYELWKMRDRIHRYGQDKKTFYYDLIANDTIDEKVIESVSRKGANSNTILEHLKRKSS